MEVIRIRSLEDLDTSFFREMEKYASHLQEDELHVIVFHKYKMFIAVTNHGNQKEHNYEIAVPAFFAVTKKECREFYSAEFSPVPKNSFRIVVFKLDFDTPLFICKDNCSARILEYLSLEQERRNEMNCLDFVLFVKDLRYIVPRYEKKGDEWEPGDIAVLCAYEEGGSVSVHFAIYMGTSYFISKIGGGCTSINIATLDDLYLIYPQATHVMIATKYKRN